MQLARTFKIQPKEKKKKDTTKEILKEKHMSMRGYIGGRGQTQNNDTLQDFRTLLPQKSQIQS